MGALQIRGAASRVRNRRIVCIRGVRMEGREDAQHTQERRSLPKEP
jgi:hypothetical protein